MASAGTMMRRLPSRRTTTERPPSGKATSFDSRTAWLRFDWKSVVRVTAKSLYIQMGYTCGALKNQATCLLARRRLARRFPVDLHGAAEGRKVVLFRFAFELGRRHGSANGVRSCLRAIEASVED